MPSISSCAFILRLNRITFTPVPISGAVDTRLRTNTLLNNAFDIQTSVHYVLKGFFRGTGEYVFTIPSFLY